MIITAIATDVRSLRFLSKIEVPQVSTIGGHPECGLPHEVCSVYPFGARGAGIVYNTRSRCISSASERYPGRIGTGNVISNDSLKICSFRKLTFRSRNYFFARGLFDLLDFRRK